MAQHAGDTQEGCGGVALAQASKVLGHVAGACRAVRVEGVRKGMMQAFSLECRQQMPRLARSSGACAAEGTRQSSKPSDPGPGKDVGIRSQVLTTASRVAAALAERQGQGKATQTFSGKCSLKSSVVHRGTGGQSRGCQASVSVPLLPVFCLAPHHMLLVFLPATLGKQMPPIAF